jgi:hypothetical protein
MADAYIIPAEILKGLIAYLSSKPHVEVHEGIAALTALEPYEEPAPSEPEPVPLRAA